MNSGPKARALAPRARRALREFFRLESAGGILLIAAAVVAMLVANSPLDGAYEHFRQLPVQIRVGDLNIAKPLLLWINDGLMAVFFLLVALEIKREVLGGQLSDRDQLVLPLICAAAGVAVPALIYFGINSADAEAMRGWAIPAATDIAFALGILSLLGARVPLPMKLLLSTIAVVDDLVAILIIAIFYTSDLSLTALTWAGAAIAGMALLNRRGVTQLAPYLLLGIVAWVCVLKSGVHATLAGVVTGLMIPLSGKRATEAGTTDVAPLETLEHALHPWVAYAILPLFAFANAGLSLAGHGWQDVLAPVSLGVAAGLVIGKPLGIVGIALLARAMGWVKLPEGMGVGALVGLGMLCGIGFTMSLFIGSLAFESVPAPLGAAVLGVLLASTIAAILGYAWLRVCLPREDR